MLTDEERAMLIRAVDDYYWNRDNQDGGLLAVVDAIADSRARPAREWLEAACSDTIESRCPSCERRPQFSFPNTIPIDHAPGCPVAAEIAELEKR